MDKQTGARIDVDTADVGDERVLLISGFPAQVCRAKAAIHQIPTENTPVSEQLSLPQRSVGRIIGRGGETIHSICVRPLEPKSLVTKNQRERYYCQDL